MNESSKPFVVWLDLYFLKFTSHNQGIPQKLVTHFCLFVYFTVAFLAEEDQLSCSAFLLHVFASAGEKVHVEQFENVSYSTFMRSN